MDNIIKEYTKHVEKVLNNLKRETINDDGNSKRTACEVYSRVVGYLRPVSQWNDAKKEEYNDRAEYKIE